MNAENFDTTLLLKMRHSPLRNYVVPGLTSWLIGSQNENGTMRLFECERDQQEAIAPHNHRFDFLCWVLRGSVKNRIWKSKFGREGDPYRARTMEFCGSPGLYEVTHGDIRWWTYEDTDYTAGQCYAMKSNEVHSIYFGRGASVLFFEGPQISSTSFALEPVVNGETVPTFKVEPWMFQRETSATSERAP